MRFTRLLPHALLTGLALFAAMGTATADTPSPSAFPEGDAGTPTDAGTDFRTATALEPGQRATANASTGDYLYWVFPADAGQNATVRTTVNLPSAGSRHGASTWQIDVYDGLRRRQACRYGNQSRVAAPDAASVTMTCHLRTVRSWAEPWANDPLPGSYYIRLTVLDLPQQDLGLPVKAEVEATTEDSGGSHDVDGRLAAPLTPGAAMGDAAQDADSTDGQPATAALEPTDGWASGWWSDRWIWTVAGGALGALAGVAGYALARGHNRTTRRMPST
ncbi:hypothetical protein AB0M87_15640 [Streptomyces sp. NPDC051320]|uniref:hypothetical protein n=1 Tax=Streptomyces sp. NPDC051320 TaxID=3154644 RepID=UPI003419BF8A